MKRVERYEEAQEKGAFKLGGMITNVSWTPEEVRRMISSKTLYLEEAPFGRLWILCADHRNQLFYQIDGSRIDEIISVSFLPGNCVSEILFSDIQEAKKGEDRKVLDKLGFSRQSSALFLSRTKTEGEPDEDRPVSCRKAEPGEAEAVEALYDICFDRLTDAIPGSEELAECIGQGAVKVACDDNKEITGTVMVQKHGRRRLIRHVAVAPEWRKRGIGTILMKAATEDMLPGENAMLWVKEDNTAAIQFYQKLGFKSAGRKMEIWVKR